MNPQSFSLRKSCFSVLSLAALLIALPVGSSVFATTTWTGAGGNSTWDYAGNWDNGLPAGTAVFRANVGVTGNALLPATASSYSVDYNTASTFNDLTISGTLSPATVTTLNVNALLTMTGLNELSPLGKLTATRAAINIATGAGMNVGADVQASALALTIASGASMTWGNNMANAGLVLNNGSTVNVLGSLSASTGSYKGNQGIQISNGGGPAVTVNVNGGSMLSDGFSVGIRGTGTLNITNGGTVTSRYVVGTPTGITSIQVGTLNNVNNVANVNVTNGTLSNEGYLKIGVGSANVDYIANTETGTLTVNGGTVTQAKETYIGQGRVGVLAVSSGSFTSASEVIVGGTNNVHLAPTGSATASGALNVSGGSLSATALRIGDGAVASGGSNPLWTIAGTFNLSGGTVTTDLLSATNASNSTVNFTGGTLNTKSTTISNGSLFAVGNGTLAASLQLNGGTHSFANGLQVKNNATVSGTGTITSTTTTVDSGARLGGNITISGATLVSGTLGVGNSPGVGNFETLTLLTGSTTEMEFNANPTPAAPGTSFDTINVSTAIAYDGTLKLVFAGAIGEGTFDLFNFGALTPTGSFSAVTLFAGVTSIGSLTNSAGIWTGSLDLGYGGGTQDFTFTQATGDFGVVPEPGTWALLAFGLLVVCVLRRRPA